MKREIINLEVEDPKWIMPWSTYLKQDGSRQYPDKEDEICFENDQAIAILLAKEVVFLSNNSWRKDIPESERQKISIHVICNDVFAWGCADCEELPYNEIENLYEFWLKDNIWGPAMWCIKQRKEMPQDPVAQRMKKAGWDLPAFQKEHGCLDNYYDSVSGIRAKHKREVYEAWCKETNRKPYAYDANWWSGWKEFTESVLDWESVEYKAETERRVSAWKENSGWQARIDNEV